jgi:hypothetical protein
VSDQNTRSEEFLFVLSCLVLSCFFFSASSQRKKEGAKKKKDKTFSSLQADFKKKVSSTLTFVSPQWQTIVTVKV